MARAAIITFDSLADSALVTNQFNGLGVNFQNAIVLAAGIGLNEIEFPPHSGANVVSNNSGSLSINFSGAQNTVSGYFTYTVPITVSAFDANSKLLGSASSPGSCPANFTSTGCAPNLFLQVTGIGSITKVSIAANPASGSFVLDDLSFASTSVPEPYSGSLVFIGLACLFAAHCKARRLNGSVN